MERLAPDVWRIDLPLPFRLRSINVYLVQGKDGCALVDTGIDTPDSRRAFFTALESIGIDQSAIRDVYVTHMHPDHIGLSGMHGRSGATIHILREEEPRARYVWSAQSLDRWIGYFTAHGLDGASASRVTEAAARLRKAVTLPDRFATLEDRDFVRLGDRAVRVVWTPGHSDFHYVLVDDDARVIFAGDHLLPAITPNIGLYPECRPNPLDDYLKSFARFERLGDYTVYPAHGNPYSALPERIHELVLHHRERLQGVWDCVSANSAGVCAADVVKHFWGDRLNAHETRFAVVEVVAHLEYLKFREDLMSSLDDGIVRYSSKRAAPTLPI